MNVWNPENCIGGGNIVILPTSEDVTYLIPVTIVPLVSSELVTPSYGNSVQQFNGCDRGHLNLHSALKEATEVTTSYVSPPELINAGTKRGFANTFQDIDGYNNKSGVLRSILKDVKSRDQKTPEVVKSGFGHSVEQLNGSDSGHFNSNSSLKELLKIEKPNEKRSKVSSTNAVVKVDESPQKPTSSDIKNLSLPLKDARVVLHRIDISGTSHIKLANAKNSTQPLDGNSCNKGNLPFLPILKDVKVMLKRMDVSGIPYPSVDKKDWLQQLDGNRSNRGNLALHSSLKNVKVKLERINISDTYSKLLNAVEKDPLQLLDGNEKVAQRKFGTDKVTMSELIFCVETKDTAVLDLNQENEDVNAKNKPQGTEQTAEKNIWEVKDNQLSHLNEKPLKCNFCTKTFNRKHLLKEHVMRHTGEFAYTCTVCNKGFTRKGVFNKHIRIHSKDTKDTDVLNLNQEKNEDVIAENKSQETKQTAAKKVEVKDDQLRHLNEKPLKCNFCMKTFNRISLLKEHVMRHTGEFAYKCTVCNKGFTRKEAFNNHILIHSKERTEKKQTPVEIRKKETSLHTCPTCGKVFIRKSVMKKHCEIHLGKQRHFCTVCTKAFNKKSTLDMHMLTHTGAKPHECYICHRRFSTKSACTRHTLTHSGEKKHECSVCNKKFTIKSHLTIHYRIHTGEKPYACDLCNEAFIRKFELDTHYAKHTGIKPYKCDVCGKGFMQMSQLSIHHRIHTGEKNFICEFCNKPYMTKMRLIEHRRSHTGEKPFPCKFCGKAFGRQLLHDRHVLIHTGAKPFTCNICNKSFNQKTTLTRHQVVHTGEKPYVCEICNNSFTQKPYFVIHMRKHTGELPYVCEFCGEAFVKKSSLTMHVCEQVIKIEFDP